MAWGNLCVWWVLVSGGINESEVENKYVYRLETHKPSPTEAHKTYIKYCFLPNICFHSIPLNFCFCPLSLTFFPSTPDFLS